MPDLTTSNDVDTLMQAADKAAIRSAIGLAAVGNSEAIGWADAAITRNAAGRVGIPAITLTQGTITAAAAIIDAAGTWNNSGVTFTGIKANITDTASTADSMLLDLRIGGVSKFTVSKASLSWVHSGNRAWYLAWDANVIRSDAYFGWASSTTVGTPGDDLALFRDAANTLAQRRGTNAQTFRLYNTYTDGSNYERGFMRWATNVLEIGAEVAGTGTARNLAILAANRLVGFGASTSDSNCDVQIGYSGSLKWSNSGSNPTSSGWHCRLFRADTGVLGLTGISGSGGGLQMQEMTAPSAPATNEVRIYAEDNGSGKTRLMARFATGAAQQIAIEP